MTQQPRARPPPPPLVLRPSLHHRSSEPAPAPAPAPCTPHVSHNPSLSLTTYSVKRLAFTLKGQRIGRPFAVKTSSAPSSPRSRKAHARPAAAEKDSSQGEDIFMATAFLQFCATCERQIMIPNNSILYCSESCRRKDAAKPLEISLATVQSMSSSLHSPPMSPPSSPPRAIVSPMTPTKLPSSSLPSLRIPVDHHEGSSDLDPTEWKPKLGAHRASNSLTSSEAFRYLSLFQRPITPAATSDNGDVVTACKDDKVDVVHPRPVPVTNSSSTSISTTGQGTLPSLGHSPTTSAASSMLDSPTGSASFFPPAPPSHPLVLSESAQRPLPPRHNPNGVGVTRDVSLVLPCIADPNNAPAAVDDKKGAGDIIPDQEKLMRDVTRLRQNTMRDSD
ncbi:hypothetical protein AJ79_03769 [Helicocarpus griseus UAMH5409]|uniref:Life-span regulatory factor domain-containing protein n=1 Tax=Helicocarpus griseus UAMH5409 TaxID=1447875 RepID=A0A2B7XWR4_9EURO|nr:hypothetical protein AJ79_03769 [Helicocarpus griseus UAMH5409]